MPFKDVGFGGVGNDVWWRVLGDGFIFAGEPLVRCSTCHRALGPKAEVTLAMFNVEGGVCSRLGGYQSQSVQDLRVFAMSEWRRVMEEWML